MPDTRGGARFAGQADGPGGTAAAGRRRFAFLRRTDLRLPNPDQPPELTPSPEQVRVRDLSQEASWTALCPVHFSMS
jgi:hypothetical protein